MSRVKSIWAELVLTACILLPGIARADWSATAGFGETLEANDNPQVDSGSGGAIGSTTNLSLQAGYDWPTVVWTIGTNLGFSKFWGTGAQDSLDGVNVGLLTTSLQKTTPLTDYHASFSGSLLPASVTEVFDSGLTNADTKTASYAAQAGLTHQINALNGIGLSVSGSSQSFTNNDSSNSRTESALTPNTYLTAGQSWIHDITPITSLTLGASTGWYTAEGDTGTDSVSESLTAQIRTQFSENLSFSGGGGGNVVRTTGPSGSGGATGHSDSTSTGFIGNLALSYALPNATISAFASHNLAPSSLGTLQELTQAGLSIARPINGISSLFFGGAFVFQVPVASAGLDSNQNQQHQGLTLTAGYHRRLTPDWNLSLAYNFTESDSGDELFRSLNDQGSSTSNAVFATITRKFDLLESPSPTSSSPGDSDWVGGAPARPKAWGPLTPNIQEVN